jgi:hypothetical protein
VGTRVFRIDAQSHASCKGHGDVHGVAEELAVEDVRRIVLRI